MHLYFPDAFSLLVLDSLTSYLTNIKVMFEDIEVLRENDCCESEVLSDTFVSVFDSMLTDIFDSKSASALAFASFNVAPYPSPERDIADTDNETTSRRIQTETTNLVAFLIIVHLSISESVKNIERRSKSVGRYFGILIRKLSDVVFSRNHNGIFEREAKLITNGGTNREHLANIE